MAEVVCTDESNWAAYVVFMIVFGLLGVLVGPLFGYFILGSTKNDQSATAVFYVRTMIMILSFVFIAEFLRGLFDVNCLFNFGTAVIGVNTDTYDGSAVYDLRWWFYIFEGIMLAEVVSQFFAHTLMPSILQKISIGFWALLGVTILRAQTHNFFWVTYFFGVCIVVIWFMMNYAYANIRPVVINVQHLAHIPVLLWLVINWLLLAFDSTLWKKEFNSDDFNLAAPWVYGLNTLIFVLAEAVAVSLLTVKRRSRNGDSNVIYPSYNNIAIEGEKGMSTVVDVGNNALSDLLFGKAKKN